jgi:uncharacterized DUF497 family protein
MKMENCGTCKYLGDLSKIGQGLICFNTNNKPPKEDIMRIFDINFICNYYSRRNIQDRFEWDPAKNKLNIEKHGIGFERAIDIFKDPNQIQMPVDPSKWEKLSEELFSTKGVARNEDNTDRVRGQIIGMIEGKVYTYVYTFRNDIGNLTSRIISLRRANAKEIEIYKSFLKDNS